MDEKEEYVVNEQVAGEIKREVKDLYSMTEGIKREVNYASVLLNSVDPRAANMYELPKAFDEAIEQLRQLVATIEKQKEL